MLIFSSNLLEADLAKENEKIIEFIKSKEGMIINTEIIGKKDLAYPIKKRNTGYYIINYFEMDPNNAKDLIRFYVLNENIIRYNLLKKD